VLSNIAYEPSRENLLGAVGIANMMTRPGDTSAAVGDGDLAVVSTSFLVRLMDGASHTAISEYLAMNETSITTQCEFRIENVIGIGMELNATATVVALDESDGRELLVFDCDIYHGAMRVAHGMVQREIVEKMRYAAKVAALSVLAQDSESESERG
jgi:predicted thioesterase